MLEVSRESDGLGSSLDSELRQQIGDVVLYRLLGKKKSLGDLSVGETLAYEVEHPLFLGGEAMGHRRRVRSQSRQDTCGGARIDDGLPRATCLMASDIWLRGASFNRKPAAPPRTASTTAVSSAKDDNIRQTSSWTPGPQFAAQRDAVDVGQPQINDRYIRRGRCQQREGLRRHPGLGPLPADRVGDRRTRLDHAARPRDRRPAGGG